MKRFSIIALVLLCCVFGLGYGFAEAADLSFKVLSAAVVDRVEGDMFGTTEGVGVLLELEVVNNGGEVKLWPADFSVGVPTENEEIRISGYLITNAVSDPEDEMAFRYFQGTAIRKGTRYFKVFFSEWMNWQLAAQLDMRSVEEATLYFRTPISGTFSVTPLIDEGDGYGGY